jgi:transcription elongation factor Elf1
MTTLNGKRMFPCPVCVHPREVRVTKKDKPYLVCDPCGVQVFIRGPAGIEEFNRLLERTSNEGFLTRLKDMQRRYRLTCAECGCQFWIEAELIKTSLLDGSLKGFRCPQKDCDAIVPWEQEQ